MDGRYLLRFLSFSTTFLTALATDRLILLRKVRPFAADEVFQVDAHFPQFSTCSFDVRLASRGKASLPMLDFLGCLVDQCGA